MQQYFLDTVVDTVATFNQEQQHHLVRVLRMHDGEIVKVVDAKSQAYLVELKVETDVVYGVVVEALKNQEEVVKITLIQGVIKKDKWDFLIQKASELGVCEIVPMMSSRSVVKLSKQDDKKIARYNKIALEACEQAKREHLVKVLPPITFNQIDSYKSEVNIIAYEDANFEASKLKAVLQANPQLTSITVVIGSEGGFSEEEVLLANQKGFSMVSLGKRILRAETAAMAVIQSILFYYE